VRRREDLLDATASVLDRGGWDALNTNAVAREAGTSIGTLYQYFRDKEALLAGLLARHEVRLQGAVEAAIARGGTDPFAVGDAVVDAFAEVWRSEPGYRAAWAASQTGGLLARTGERWGADFTQRFTVLFRGYFPHLAPEAAPVMARTAVHLVSGLLLAAAAGSARGERAMIEETKLVLRAYLAARAAPPG
jgi:AcrR family transcriptional regulator